MDDSAEFYDETNIDEISQAKDMGYKLAQEIRSLRNKNSEQKEIINELISSKSDIWKKYQTLSKQYSETHNFNKEINAKCQKLQDLISNLEIYQKEEKLNFESEMLSMQKQLHYYTNANDELQKELNNISQISNGYFNELNEMKSQYCILKNENSMHIQKIDCLQNHSASLQKLYDDATINSKVLASQLNSNKNMNDELQIKIESLETSVVNYKNEYECKLNNIVHLEQDLENYTILISNLTQEVKDLKYKILLYENDLDTCCEHEKNDYKIKINELLQENRDKDVQLHEKNEELQALKYSNKKLNERLYKNQKHVHCYSFANGSMSSDYCSDSSSTCCDESGNGSVDHSGYKQHIRMNEKLKNKCMRYRTIIEKLKADVHVLSNQHEVEQEKSKKLYDAIKIYEDMFQNIPDIPFDSWNS